MHLCVCVRVRVCCLELSVSGVPAPEHTLWFYYRSMFAVKLLCRLARTCPAQGREAESHVGSRGRSGQAPSSHSGAQTSWAAGRPGRPRAGPGMRRGLPELGGRCPWLPGGDAGVTTTAPHGDLGPLPQRALLSAEEQASSDLPAGSPCREPVPSRGLQRAGDAGACRETATPPWPSGGRGSPPPPWGATPLGLTRAKPSSPGMPQPPGRRGGG